MISPLVTIPQGTMILTNLSMDYIKKSFFVDLNFSGPMVLEKILKYFPSIIIISKMVTPVVASPYPQQPEFYKIDSGFRLCLEASM
jgi:hypothetical protein